MNSVAARVVFLLILVGGPAACGGSGGTADIPPSVPVDLVVPVDSVEEISPEAEVPPRYPLDDELRLNHLQAEGTHNSYHKWCPEGVHLKEYFYEMPPLDQQLGIHGVRQYEIDIHQDPETGDLLVYHAPVFDNETTCDTLELCLKIMRKWSDKHPDHHALFIFIEPKDDIPPLAEFSNYELLDEVVLDAWPRERIIAPDDIRGDHPTLREGMLENGWPTLGESRGKALFVILDTGVHQAAYLELHPGLKGSPLFVKSHVDDPFAAVLSLDDPLSGEEEIVAAVSQGFIVRTRSDTETDYIDPERVEAALRSGAHCLSTNFPGPNETMDWFFEIPGGTPSRCNPVTAPAFCTSEAIENPGR